MKKLLAVAACMALAACVSPEELRQRPAAWSALYPVAYDAMAHCVAIESSGFAKSVVPFVSAKEKRAEVMVLGGYGETIAQFDLRDTGDGMTAVEYRNLYARGRLGADNPGDRILRQCARS